MSTVSRVHNQRILQETYQKTLQSRLFVSQTRIRNKSRMSGLCGRFEGEGIPYEVDSSPVQVTRRPGNWETFCALLGSYGTKTSSSLP